MIAEDEMTHVCGHPDWHTSTASYIDCEIWVLAAGCYSTGLFAEFVHKVTPEHFTDPSRAMMFSVMLAQWQANPLIDRDDWDLVAIAEALGIRRNGTVDASCEHGRAFREVWELALLPHHEFSPWRRCLQSIMDRHERIKRRKASLALANAIDKNGDDHQAAQQLVSILSESHENREEDFTADALFRETVKAIDAPKPPRVITGCAALDGIIGGLENGSLNVLAGRPGTGKTTFAIHLARSYARAGGGVSFYSLEMTARNLGQIVVCQEAGIDYESVIDKSKMREIDFQKLLDSAERICAMNARTISTPGLTIEQFASKASRDVDQGKTLIVLDYLQLLRTAKDYRQRYDQVAYISGELKQLALRLDVPIIALCQMNREVEKDAKRRWPRMADLRESGTIEQDADTISFLTFHPEETKPEKDADIVKVCLLVEKNRNGRVGMRPFHFDKPKRRILDVADFTSQQRVTYA